MTLDGGPGVLGYAPGDPVVVAAGAPTVVLVDRGAYPDVEGREIALAAAGAGALIEEGATRADKPRLVGTDLTFNLSDTTDLAGIGWLAVALGRGIEVGVDIESADRRTVHTRRLAQRTLAPAELAAVVGPDNLDNLDNLDGEALDRALIIMWTRKEAVLKAHGTGLTRDLRTLDVSGDEVNVDGVTWRCHTERWPTDRRAHRPTDEPDPIVSDLIVSVAWPA